MNDLGAHAQWAMEIEAVACAHCAVASAEFKDGKISAVIILKANVLLPKNNIPQPIGALRFPQPGS
jgi:hypothetical protein